MSEIPAPVPVPLLDLKKQYATIKSEVRPVIDEVCDAQGFILGPRVEAFEKAIATYVGTKHAIGMSSGTDSQLAAMMAAGVGPGDDVVTSPYSFFSTAGAVARLGARAVFCDIEPETFNLDPAKLAAAITPRTKVIQPVHLYGQCSDMDPILEVAKAKGIPVLEDACQSLGAAYKGRRAGAHGTFGAFSFFPSKNLGGFGDGGIVTTDDDEMATTLRALRTHGETTRYHHRIVGGNFRLDALQAAAAQELDRAKRKEILARVQLYLHDNGPYYFVWADLGHKGYSANVATNGELGPIDYTSFYDWWNLDSWIVKP